MTHEQGHRPEPDPLGVPQFLTGDNLAEVESILPSEAVADLDDACIVRLWQMQHPEEPDIEPDLREFAKAASRLLDAQNALSTRGLSTLLMYFESERAGRMLFGRRPMSQVRRIITRSEKGSRILFEIIRGAMEAAEKAADDEAGRLWEERAVRKAGRPISDDWMLAADVAAVCAANAINPSEASDPFMRVIGAVWSSAGREASPTHAVRTMRKMLKAQFADGGQYVLHLPTRNRCYELRSDDRGRMVAEHMTRGEQWRKQEIRSRIPDLLAPEIRKR